MSERVAVVRLLDGSVYDASAVKVEAGIVEAVARRRRGGAEPGESRRYAWGPLEVKSVRWDTEEAA